MPEPVQIDNSEANTDWIKTAENRKTEAEIHRLLAEEYAKTHPEEQELEATSE